jgi:hypothetical protein
VDFASFNCYRLFVIFPTIRLFAQGRLDFLDDLEVLLAKTSRKSEARAKEGREPQASRTIFIDAWTTKN